MKITEKLEYIQNKHFSEWVNTRNQVDTEFSMKQPIFCLCGKLATGLHESNCRKFKDAVIKETVRRLEPLLPKEVTPMPENREVWEKSIPPEKGLSLREAVKIVHQITDVKPNYSLGMQGKRYSIEGYPFTVTKKAFDAIETILSMAESHIAEVDKKRESFELRKIVEEQGNLIDKIRTLSKQDEQELSQMKERASVERIANLISEKIDFPYKPNYLFVHKFYPSSGVDRLYEQQEQILLFAQAIVDTINGVRIHPGVK